MSSLSYLINSPNNPKAHQPLILLQSTKAQTCLPVLRSLIKPAKPPSQTLLFCFLYPPSTLTDTDFQKLDVSDNGLKIFDYTASIPGYDDQWSDHTESILSTVESAPPGTLNVIIDSLDTLASDISSTQKAYKFVRRLLTLVTARQHPSSLIAHLLPCPLLPPLTQTSLSPALLHAIAHAPALLSHIATAYMTPPPPAGPPEKFWGVFIPIAERSYESERLIFGPDGEGSSGGAWAGNGSGSGSRSGKADMREMVVEVLVRGKGDGRKRAVERTLEGWRGQCPCELEALESLKSVMLRKRVEQAAPDPTQNVSFKLSLTPSQEKSRAQVPLPYAHEGQASNTTSSSSTPATILYDPDSADDLDDDDPDEDLNI
ncbi:hypothetical protein SERLA73DRAFT_182795 [Serpula lacrymans var. lacrymans S7.3]|uniref:Elongator complex protein 5 n=2 Tax=Serpula lacrymans var. lacrymans TaxID=341189 RepID=F8Q106_SERL3|nr:uncharacterized protein SERLADRAFT_469622 [Serpula lacrymans var. lacrymans S7.9]EGN97984.1 hypothetical protein SERLA73DRAFT_182795 [Serpula lacrymans var. lacrymans S7.3]EGO23575.1 hypothetical protein SERLADRAFT_469622 [Serpula lacrymans var. lacrymans S7.9]